MAQQESGRSRGWIGGVAALAACVVLFLVVRSMTHGKVTVRVATVEYQDIRSTVSTNGKVESVSDYQASAMMPGTVTKLFVEVGQKVSAGQELIRMDDSDQLSRVASAQANVAAAEATLQNMKRGGTTAETLSASNDLQAAQLQKQQAASALTSLRNLEAKGAASANEVVAAQQKLQDAETRLAAVQSRRTGTYGASDLVTQEAQVAQARIALQAAESALGGVDIRSPMAGTVYSVPVQEHDFVPGGGVLLNVADLTRLHVRAFFDEPEIGKLAVGQPVKIVWDAKPGESWHGHILQAPATIIPYGTRNIGECVISVDDAQDDLLPNTNVTVTVITKEKAHVLSVPREALHTAGQSDFVYKVVNGRLLKTPVQLGVVNLTQVEITGGLVEGDTVALDATTEAELRDGLEVKAQP